jgi:hypothetical protein
LQEVHFAVTEMRVSNIGWPVYDEVRQSGAHGGSFDERPSNDL